MRSGSMVPVRLLGGAARLRRCAQTWRALGGLQRQTFASSSVQPVAPQASRGVQPFGLEQGSSLAELAERGSFLPKPELFDERLKPGFRGGRALFIFFLCNALPFGGLLYYLREKREERSRLSLSAVPSTSEDLAAEALRIIRTAAICFLVPQCGDLAGRDLLHVDPHPPEATAFVPPSEPLPLVPSLERNIVTDLLESPSAAGLGFIQFALSRKSTLGAAVLAGERRGDLLYVSHVRGAYCTVTGQVSVLADREARRRYWKGSWASSFPLAIAANDEVKSGQEVQPWTQPDYLLIRLAVTEVSVHAITDGPQRWHCRKVRRQHGVCGESKPLWAFAT